MKYTLKIYNLNLNTNEYEQANTFTCDDDSAAKEDLLYMYKNRDEKPLFKKYRFSYTHNGVNITCKFLHPTDYKNGDPCDFKYTCKYEYQFIY